MPKFTFSESAFVDYLDWQQNDKPTAAKINRLLKEIARTPFSGLGKPEPLRHSKAGSWSRRINELDRLVYEVKDNEIFIASCKGHYD